MISTFTAAPATPAAPDPTSPTSPTSWNAASRRVINSVRPAIKTKSKRIQVSRACAWCHVHRVKCDNTHPCQNCKARGIECSDKEASQVHTLPQAFREIEKLRQKVKELEEELENSSATAPNQQELEREPEQEPGHDSAFIRAPSEPSRPEVVVANNTLVNSKPASPRRRYWRGVYASPNNTDAKQYFGPSSLIYFIKWMEDFLVTTLQQPTRDHIICFNWANKPFASPFPESTREFGEHITPVDCTETNKPGRAERYLTTTQEEYFLELWWQSYHNSMQILDEHAFREHYRSLCSMPGNSRKPFALVDIIMAICMQHGIAQPEQTLAASDHVVIGVDDATIAGRWYYYRSQTLLAAEMENPTIGTLQCQILSVIFLSNAAFQTSAYKMLGMAVRTAQILGLHLEPDGNLLLADRELRKRIWWTLQTLEIKKSIKHGRLRMLSPDPELCCSLPSDDYHLALLSSSTTSRIEGVTWLTYTVETTKLALAAHATHVDFFDKCNELLTQHGCDTIYDHHRVLEDCASYLQKRLRGPQGLHMWLGGVPDGLKCKRKGEGKAYSTDGSALELERFAPTWLQHQRLLLELFYHHLSVNLLPSRSFRSEWSSSSLTFDGGSTPLAHQNARSCVKHAMALTSMIHDALSNTEHLVGWYEAFQWQWDAAVSIVGFILSNPGADKLHCDARHAIDYAIEVFSIFGRHFAMATSAANMIRDLAATADRLVERRREVLTTGGGLSVIGNSLEELMDFGNDNVALGLQQRVAEATGTLFDESMLDEDVRDLLDSAINMSHGLESFGSVDFSLPGTTSFFDG
ncbi:hypothetical protein DM02DRAFT_588457 [Periconia macrospinosa]|uniref:Zn(2)-C6 fungal-type domain-containing protein n=1 Tax=Periconia macrospinosa TaxID=97972 RepID=A0A2V1DX99_9PLEO|nr:hypothetical protein DM02DRAFT_588457 [Periconia macrospinosa]